MAWNFLSRNSKNEAIAPTSPVQPPGVERRFTGEGIVWSVPGQPDCEWLDEPFTFAKDGELASFLSQLEEEGFAESAGEGILLPWQSLFQLLSLPDFPTSIPLLRLPELGHCRPVLSSRGSLSDPDFSVTIASWIDRSGCPISGVTGVHGALLLHSGTETLLPEASWRVVQAVASFHRRPEEGRSAEENRRAWAEIRRYALEAKADLGDFLRKTVVVTPERLQLSLNRTEVGGLRSVEVVPGFAGAPERWLEIFDRYGAVQERYEIPDGEGLVHVLVSSEVQAVLGEIKALPGRRVAGERGEAFIRNPFSALGPDAEKVLDPEEFEQARDAAGIAFTRFTAVIERDSRGFPKEVHLLVEEMLHEDVHTEIVPFEGPEDLSRFVVRLEERIDRGCQCCLWEGYELEILGDSRDQLLALKEALAQWESRDSFDCAELFDLSNYSERVEGIGEEKPYFSPFIARKSDGDGWVPDNVMYALSFTPAGASAPVSVPVDDALLVKMKDALQEAKSQGHQKFSFPDCPRPVPVAEAEQILSAFKTASDAVAGGTFPPDGTFRKKGAPRKGLVVKANIEALDYVEEGSRLRLPEGVRPRLPTNLKQEVRLKDHQLRGVAWLQHLWHCSPSACRGAVLADDMGLGKTLQLLTFISKCLEDDPSLDPVLVVAPVALLENWKEETEKFFVAGSLPILTLYGDTLAAVRAPRASIGAELQSNGITRLLRRDWLAGSKIVLTTYETLRDLEFSLAAQKWSVMVCDEAQKIKNPNAMVTRAAKKQNVRFRVACTGTPVENTLTDLWCLFDFVQPGLLGALNEFGTHYRRPIEAKTDEERERVEQLRSLISPQILRREKKEVAQDLPTKYIVQGCRSLQISDFQRGLYSHAVTLYRMEKEEGRKGGILGLLHHLRHICSDPRPLGQQGTDSEPVDDIVTRSPKMVWLLEELERIRGAGEKVLIFCELLDLQRTLRRCIHHRLCVTPDVINGSTSASGSNPLSRQKRIKTFQEKPGFGVIILSPLAAGFGLNIQAANHVIHFTRLWNPAKEDQATDRAYRIGQTRDVHVYYPVIVASEFTTFDAKLDSLLEWKRELSSDMLNGTGELNMADFADLQDVDGEAAVVDEPISPDDIPKMTPEAFEAFCALLWGAQGFSTVYRTPHSNDGGVDVVAIGGRVGSLIQCKTSSKEGQRLGWEAVKDVVTGEAAYAQRHPGVDFKKVAVTNQYFNDAAEAQAILNGVDLVNRENLERILEQFPVRQAALERLLVAEGRP